MGGYLSQRELMRRCANVWDLASRQHLVQNLPRRIDTEEVVERVSKVVADALFGKYPSEGVFIMPQCPLLQWGFRQSLRRALRYD